MPLDVSSPASSFRLAPHQLTQAELFVIQQVRALKRLHPESVLFGKRIAALVGSQWDESFRDLLGGLVQRRLLAHTEIGGYAANEWMMSHLSGSGLELGADKLL